MEANNIFEVIPEALAGEVFSTIVQSDTVRIERIISKGHTSPPSGWYDQEQAEWVLVLRGEAVISYPTGEEARLTAGSHINIPAHTRHKVKWTTTETETVWLAVYY